MQRHDHRVLREFGVTSAEWAVLFVASHFTPIGLDALTELALHEADGDATREDISHAVRECTARGWLVFTQVESAEDGPGGYTVTLSGLGYEIKNSLVVALMESVELV